MDPATAAIAASTIQGLIGGIGAYQNASSQKAALTKLQDYYESLPEELQRQYASRVKAVTDAYQPIIDAAGGDQAIQAYYDYIKGFKPEDYVYTPEEYVDTTGTVESYMDPALAYKQEQGRKQLEMSAANKGNLFGLGTAKQLAADSEARASLEYQAAADRKSTEEQKKYSRYTDSVSRARQTLADKLAAFNTGSSYKRTAFEDVTGAQSNIAQGTKASQDILNQNLLAAQESAKLAEAQGKGINKWGALLQGVGGGAAQGASTGLNLANAYNTYSGSKATTGTTNLGA